MDESGFNLTLRRTRGRSKAGVPAKLVVPSIRAKNISVMAAISHNGLQKYNILEGNGNGEKFREFLRDLVQVIPPQSTILMDNVPFHRNAEALEIIRAAGHSHRFIPPYSPFFNPIENFFGEWKGFVRNRRPNTEQELLEELRSVDTHANITAHIQGYFRRVNSNCIKCLSNDRNLS
jgi:transposase